MQEIGGYIELEYFHGDEYHPNALPLNSGRHCLEYLLRAKNIRKLYVPYFMCACIDPICERVGVSVTLYHTDIHFMPLLDAEQCSDGWVYIVNYYGQIDEVKAAALKERYTKIIFDNAQAFFQMPLPGVDTLYTCRKFFGVADGAYLYTDARLENEPELDLSYDRMDFLLGRFEKSASEFYARSAANNDYFETQPIKRMSKLTRNLLCGVDYDFVRQRRTDNFGYLHQQLGSINKLQLQVPDGAFMYPLYIENGAQIRRALQQKRIYIPTLWPDVFERCDKACVEYDMAQNILPLPTDQRYSLEDMETLCRNIQKER